MQRTIKLSQSGIFPVCLLYSTVRCSDAARFDLLLFCFFSVSRFHAAEELNHRRQSSESRAPDGLAVGAVSPVIAGDQRPPPDRLCLGASSPSCWAAVPSLLHSGKFCSPRGEGDSSQLVERSPSCEALCRTLTPLTVNYGSHRSRRRVSSVFAIDAPRVYISVAMLFSSYPPGSGASLT